jgi:predicted nucleic acid-binding protein
MILLDTGPIVAFFDASNFYHSICIEALKDIEGPLLTTWPVLTEAFYLLGFSWKAQNNHKDFTVYRPCHTKSFTLIPAQLLK